MQSIKNLLDGNIIFQVQKRLLSEKSEKLRNGHKLHVCFFVSQKQFWSMQSVYDALAENRCFKLSVVPFPVLFHQAERKKNYEDLCNFHKEKGASVLQVCNFKYRLLAQPEDIAPDIIFYEQHWMGNYPPAYCITNMWSKALCICMPYGVMMANIPEEQFNGVAHNLSWRNFTETPIHFILSKKYAENKGVNTVVSGYPKLDAYSRPVVKNYWKTQSPAIKRIIWAPHYSLNTCSNIEFSTFLNYWKAFLSLVKNNSDRIEMVLKPHPALKSRFLALGLPGGMYDRFMAEWDALPNASVVTDADYIDLFTTSDAIILDSVSFTAEYMVTEKPICFLSRYPSFEKLSANFNPFGKRVISLVDIAYNYAEVQDFIQNVCGGTARVSDERRYFTSETLKVNFGHVGEFIVNHILEQLHAV